MTKLEENLLTTIQTMWEPSAGCFVDDAFIDTYHEDNQGVTASEVKQAIKSLKKQKLIRTRTIDGMRAYAPTTKH